MNVSQLKTLQSRSQISEEIDGSPGDAVGTDNWKSIEKAHIIQPILALNTGKVHNGEHKTEQHLHNDPIEEGVFGLKVDSSESSIFVGCLVEQNLGNGVVDEERANVGSAELCQNAVNRLIDGNVVEVEVWEGESRVEVALGVDFSTPNHHDINNSAYEANFCGVEFVVGVENDGPRAEVDYAEETQKFGETLSESEIFLVLFFHIFF